ncbi:MAG: hypothetical protein RL684_297 [Pseudomonadota bacterium]|jgi:predicted nucleic-acid-binding protein
MSIGLDTNILARYYIEDAGDAEAQKQRERARQLIDSGDDLGFARRAQRLGLVPRVIVPR